MTEGFSIPESQIYQPPKRSDWECEIVRGMLWRPEEGGEPNWFWRKMQFLVLGFRWRKVSE